MGVAVEYTINSIGNCWLRASYETMNEGERMGKRAKNCWLFNTIHWKLREYWEFLKIFTGLYTVFT